MGEPFQVYFAGLYGEADFKAFKAISALISSLIINYIFVICIFGKYYSTHVRLDKKPI